MAKALEEHLGLHIEAKSVNVDVINVVSVTTPKEVVPVVTYTINFLNADIGQVVAAVAKATLKTFFVDPGVLAQVTMSSLTTVSSAQFYQAFLNILRDNHFVAVTTGDVVKILPEANAH